MLLSLPLILAKHFLKSGDGLVGGNDVVCPNVGDDALQHGGSLVVSEVAVIDESPDELVQDSEGNEIANVASRRFVGHYGSPRCFN